MPATIQFERRPSYLVFTARNSLHKGSVRYFFRSELLESVNCGYLRIGNLFGMCPLIFIPFSARSSSGHKLDRYLI